MSNRFIARKKQGGPTLDRILKEEGEGAFTPDQRMSRSPIYQDCNDNTVGVTRKTAVHYIPFRKAAVYIITKEGENISWQRTCISFPRFSIQDLYIDPSSRKIF